jgi:ABC-type transport system involved in cytochrome bd biosynthesis fused ATPase/permease subunit
LDKDVNIKTDENKKQFDMNIINEDIETILMNFSIYGPQRMKRIVMTILCPVAMFYISWQFAVVCFGGLILLALFNQVS